MYRLFYILFTSLLLAIPSQANNWENANQLFQLQQYDQAIHTYQQIPNYQQHDAVLYNIGTAYLQKQDIGNAIINFEKAIKINPSQTKYQRNLKIAQEQISNPIKDQSFFLFTALKKFTQLLSMNTWSILLLLSSISIFLYQLAPLILKRHLPKLLLYIGGSGLLVALFSISLHYGYYNQLQYGIITVDKQQYYITAKLKEKATRTLPAGTKVEVLKKTNNYYKIQLPNGIIGFVKPETLVNI